MTSGGNSQQEKKGKKWSKHVPILWKRKIKSFVNNDPQKALIDLFEDLKKNKDTKYAIYGLELLLPDSLTYIANSLKNLEPNEITRFLELLTSELFIKSIKNLDEKLQKEILTKLYQNCELDLISENTIEELISKLDYNLIESLYGKLTEEISDSKPLTSLKLIKLWGMNNNRIQPILLKKYLKNPIKAIENYLGEINPKDRIFAFKSEEEAFINSTSQFKILLPLISTSKEEIEYIFVLQPLLPVKSKDLLKTWLLEKNISLEELIEIYETKMGDENKLFITTFLKNGITKEKFKASEVLYSLLRFKDEETVHALLKKLSSHKESPTNMIISVISQLENKALNHLKFLQSELEIYSKQDIESIIIAYITSKNDSYKRIYLPAIQKEASNNWKVIIETLAQNKGISSKSQASDLFLNCDIHTKRNIGRYLIEKNLISELIFLFQDFEIFYSILVTDRKISVLTMDHVLHFVKYHVQNNFSEIIQIGEKLTFSRYTLSSLMEENQLEMLIDPMIATPEFLISWKDIFVARVQETLPLTLKKYKDSLPRNQKKKENLIDLLKMLIKIEPILFWENLSNYPIQDISKPAFKPIIIYGFEVAIPNIGTIMSTMPDSHLTYLIDYILAELIPSGSKILYSLFAFQNVEDIQESVIQRIIFTLIRLDEDNNLRISLMRCSKIIETSKLSEFASKLVKKLIADYPLSSFFIITDYNLTTLFNQIGTYLTTLPLKEQADLLLKIIPVHKSQRLETIIINRLLALVNLTKNDITYFERLSEKYEEEEFAKGGKKIYEKFFSSLLGKSPNLDFHIFTILKNKPRNQLFLLPLFFNKTSIHFIERILLDPTSGPLEKQTITAIINHFEIEPPNNPEKYFLSLYNKTANREDIQEAILPLLGEYCSWQNLYILMEIPEKEKYSRSYEKALAKFSSRFDIQSPRALLEIWNSGLKDMYQKPSEQSISGFHSQCPQCGNPILENQRNCGFCNQRFICSICRKSVISLEKKDIIQCPQCASFFHRSHLLESVKLKKNCPVCNVQLEEKKVETIQSYIFFFTN